MAIVTTKNPAEAEEMQKKGFKLLGIDTKKQSAPAVYSFDDGRDETKEAEEPKEKKVKK